MVTSKYLMPIPNYTLAPTSRFPSKDVTTAKRATAELTIIRINVW